MWDAPPVAWLLQPQCFPPRSAVANKVPGDPQEVAWRAQEHPRTPSARPSRGRQGFPGPGARQGLVLVPGNHIHSNPVKA